MKKIKNRLKGFTLVELLAVIVVLAIILVIAIPAIGNIIARAREDSIESDINMMKVSARTYITKTGEYIPEEGQSEVIPLSKLIEKGYISKIYYPDGSNKECDGVVIVTNTSGKYTYKGYLNCGSGGYVSPNISEVYEVLNDSILDKIVNKLENNISLLPGTDSTTMLDIEENLNLAVENPMDLDNNLSGDVIVNHGDSITGEGIIVEINGEEYEIIIIVDGSQDEETVNADITGANPPILATNMIPVKYNESTKKWIKADVTNAGGVNQWYDYGYNKQDSTDSSRWANGVMVKSTVRDAYLNAEPGTEIVFTDILQFYVWIPRYKYRIESANFHKSTPGLVGVKFEKGIKRTGITTVNATTGFDDGKYLTHPAFCVTNNDDNNDGKLSTYLGDDCTDVNDWNLEGFWVGKFETSYSSGISTILPTVNGNHLEAATYSYATNFYNGAKALNNTNNAFGFAEPRDDTHLMKNSEWGAVAYLSNSTYGRGNSEVWINNSTYYNFLGCSGGSATAASNQSHTDCEYDYNNDVYGGQSSTTGNVYGIYDMSGGQKEYLAATKQENNSFNTSIYADINTKYVDDMGTMPGSITLNGTIGMGMYEVSNVTPSGNAWYQDTFSYSQGYSLYTYPVFVRGGYAWDTTGAGLYSYYVYEGYADYDIGWRIALVVE